MTNKAYTTTARAAHHAALETLRAPGCKASGLAIWRKLRRIERKAHDAATAQCNAAAFNGQPFRPDYLADGSEGTPENPTPWEVFSDSIRAEVAAAFGGTLPQGFRFNQDPRGYALKIEPAPAGMWTDWGRSGILAAEIN